MFHLNIYLKIELYSSSTLELSMDPATVIFTQYPTLAAIAAHLKEDDIISLSTIHSRTKLLPIPYYQEWDGGCNTVSGQYQNGKRIGRWVWIYGGGQIIVKGDYSPAGNFYLLV